MLINGVWIITELDTLCEHLQRNDQTVTTVKTYLLHGRPVDTVQRLGQALTENTHVTRLELDMEGCLGPANRSNNDDTATTTTGVDIADAYPLLEYIRSSSSLSEVVVDHMYVMNITITPTLLLFVELLCQAVAANPGITVFISRGVTYLPRTIPNLLQSSTSLVELVLLTASEEHERGRAGTVWNAHFVEALSVNTTLQKVLLYADVVDRVEHDMAILAALGSHSRLQSLNVHLGWPVQFGTLARLLSTTHTIEHLAIGHLTDSMVVQCETELRLILHALQHANRSVTHLVLRGFCLDEAGTAALRTFVRDTCNQGDVVVRDVTLKGQFRLVDPELSSLGKVLASMLVGSHLQGFGYVYNRASAGMNHTTDVEDFFDELVQYQNAAVGTIQLSRLTLGFMTPPCVQAMHRYLAVTTTLRELEVLQLRRDVNETELLAALRINGSLYKVSLSYHGNIRQFDERWKRRSLAYCQRNQQVPLLLAKPSLKEALVTPNETTVAQDDRNQPCGNSIDSVGGEAQGCRQVPSLFQVAHPAPRLVANSMLQGLLLVASNDD